VIVTGVLSKGIGDGLDAVRLWCAWLRLTPHEATRSRKKRGFCHSGGAPLDESYGAQLRPMRILTTNGYDEARGLQPFQTT